jgi:hypothetical protein
VGTLHPNHTWEKVVFDPWQQTSYDLNDTVLMDPASDLQLGEYFRRLRDDDYLPTWHALRTDPAHMADALARWPAVQRRQDETAAATKAAAHADTPAVIPFDSLGRAFLSISNNGPEGKCETRTKLDIEGNPLSILDDRDNMVMSYRLLIQDGVPVSGYDLAGRRLYEKSMDSGERHMLMDVGGKPIRSWNNRGHILRSTYDALQRPLATYLGQGNDPDQLVTLILYGEKHPRAEALNLRGQIFQTYDQAGVTTGGGIDPESNRSEAFDFKGNLLRSSRQLAVNYKSTVDWMVLEPFLSSQIVDPDVFESATASLVQGEIFTDEYTLRRAQSFN